MKGGVEIKTRAPTTPLGNMPSLKHMFRLGIPPCELSVICISFYFVILSNTKLLQLALINLNFLVLKLIQFFFYQLFLHFKIALLLIRVELACV